MPPSLLLHSGGFSPPKNNAGGRNSNTRSPPARIKKTNKWTDILRQDLDRLTAVHAQLKVEHKEKMGAQAGQIAHLTRELTKEQQRLRQVHEALGGVAGGGALAASNSTREKAEAAASVPTIQQKLAAVASQHAATTQALSDALGVQRQQVATLAAELEAEKQAAAKIAAARDLQTATARSAASKLAAVTLRAAELETQLQTAAERHAQGMVARDCALASAQARLESVAVELEEAQRAAAALADAHTEHERQAAEASAALEAAAHRAGHLEVLLSRVSEMVSNGNAEEQKEWAEIDRLTAALASENSAVLSLTNDVVVAKTLAAGAAIKKEDAEAVVPMIAKRLAQAAEKHAVATRKLTAAIASQQLHVESLAAELAAANESAATIAAARDYQTAAVAVAAGQLAAALRRATELESSLQAAAEQHAAEMVVRERSLAEKQSELEALAQQLCDAQRAAAEVASDDVPLDLSAIAAILSSPPGSPTRGGAGSAGGAAAVMPSSQSSGNRGDGGGGANGGGGGGGGNGAMRALSDRELGAWLERAVQEDADDDAIIDSAHTMVAHAQLNFETLLEGMLAVEPSALLTRELLDSSGDGAPSLLDAIPEDSSDSSDSSGDGGDAGDEDRDSYGRRSNGNDGAAAAAAAAASSRRAALLAELLGSDDDDDDEEEEEEEEEAVFADNVYAEDYGVSTVPGMMMLPPDDPAASLDPSCVQGGRLNLISARNALGIDAGSGLVAAESDGTGVRDTVVD